MKKIIGYVIFTLVAALGVYGLYTSQVNSHKSELTKRVKTVNTTVQKLKSKEEYSKISDKNWEKISNPIKGADSEQEYQESYNWSLKGSLDSYSEDKKIGLISYKDLKEKINSKEDFIVLFSQPLCPHCKKLKNEGYAEYAEKQIKNNKKVYMINSALEIDTWNDKTLWNNKNDKSQTKSKSNNSGVPGTPALVHYKKGKNISGISSDDFKEISKYLKTENF